jgi:hypothetical protein
MVLKVPHQHCLLQVQYIVHFQIQLTHHIEHLKARKYEQYHLQLEVQFLLPQCSTRFKTFYLLSNIAEISAGLISAILIYNLDT